MIMRCLVAGELDSFRNKKHYSTVRSLGHSVCSWDLQEMNVDWAEGFIWSSISFIKFQSIIWRDSRLSHAYRSLPEGGTLTEGIEVKCPSPKSCPMHFFLWLLIYILFNTINQQMYFPGFNNPFQHIYQTQCAGSRNYHLIDFFYQTYKQKKSTICNWPLK